MKNWGIAIMGVCIIALVILYINKDSQNPGNKYEPIDSSLNAAYKEFNNDILDMVSYHKSRPEHDSLRAAPYFKKIDIIRKSIKELTAYMDQVTDTLQKESGDKNIVNKLMMDGGMADTLKKQIDNTTQLMICSLSEEDKHIVHDMGEAIRNDRHWKANHFRDVPVGMAKLELSSIKCDLAREELQVINLLYYYARNEHYVSIIPFKAVAFPQTSDVLYPGEKYEANIMLLKAEPQYDEDLIYPHHIINGMRVDGKDLEVEDNVGTYTAIATAEGEKTYTGSVSATNVNGNIIEFSFSKSYTVVKPTAVVSADDERVLYTGVENPISVCGAYVLPENLVVTVNCGTISGSNGHYIYTTNEPGNVTIKVSAKTKTGKPYPIDSVVFTVKAKE